MKNQCPINIVSATLSNLRNTFTASGLFLALLVLFGSAGLSLAQPVTAVHINEVESNGGTPGDWFELINTGATPANLSGWTMLDNDSTHAPYVFPAGSIIAPGGYLVVEEANFVFGLGAADSVRIFDSTGALYESYSWTAHAATTYGRCPNGTGALTTTNSSTKGAANDCGVTVTINEVESNGGVPGDWVELFNPGAAAANLSGFVFKDNDDTHAYVIPAGTNIQPGGYLVLDEAQFVFGLGSADSARLFDNAGALVDSYTWTAHAATTYGRCPNGTGAFTTTASSTKGAVNDCVAPVTINEVESNLGVPGDWVEIYNPNAGPANVGGFVFKDNDDTHGYVIPAGTTIPAGGYLVLEEAQFVFGLGSADSARLFDTAGTLIDSYSWTAHAATTYGRCPNGNGAFVTTTAPTKGLANACPGVLTFQPWPGGAAVQTVDGTNVFGGNLSGFVYEGSGTAAPGVLWGVRNGPGSIFRLIFNGTMWTPDPANNWGAGKLLLFPGGIGSPDSEGITFAGPNSSDGLYVSVERDNNANAISRNSILRFDPSVAGTTLTATNEWNLTGDLPITGANLGAEAVTWIPDTFLTASGFFDASRNHAYKPSEYPNHGTGLFFVGLEANGNVYAYALDHGPGGQFTRIATMTSGLAGVMDLQFDSSNSNLWAICDDTCQGRSVVFRIDATGSFTVAGAFERPSGMQNFNNEGFGITPASECVANLRPVFWADDSEDNGHAIRSGTLSCSQVIGVTDLTISETHTGTLAPGQNGATYTTTVRNDGTLPTVGLVTVTNTLPAALTATAIAGSGWSCAQPSGPCTRSDVLAAGALYPSLTLTVNIAPNASATLANTVTVSGGGDFITSNNTATHSATILPSILSVNPTEVPASVMSQTVVVNGSGFQNGPGLRVRVSNGTFQTDLTPTFLSSTQLSVQINVGPQAAAWMAQVFNPNGQSSNVFGFPVVVPQITSFVLPQLVFGGGSWYTALYFANTTDSLVHVHMDFFADNGGPLTVPLLGIGPVTSQNLNINPHSSAILEAPKTGALTQGWVGVDLPSGVSSYAVLRQSVPGRADQEAVVPLTPKANQMADLIYDDVHLTTAIALLNATDSAQIMTIATFGPDGASTGSTQLPLAPRSKLTAVLKSLPGLAGISGKQGRAVFTGSSGAVSILGLRFGGEAFTSIPQRAPDTSPISLALPQFAFGGSWYTALYFSNTTNATVTVPLTFIANNGAPLDVPLVGIGTVSSTAVTLRPGGTAVLEALNFSNPGEGWVDAALPPGVNGYGVYRQVIAGRADQEAVVPLTSEFSQAADLVYDDIQFTTAVAFLNPSDQVATVTITVYSTNGSQIGSGQVTLAPHAKVSTILKDLPGLSGMAGNLGWAAFSVPNGDVSVLGLRFGGQAFTSIPITQR